MCCTCPYGNHTVSIAIFAHLCQYSLLYVGDCSSSGNDSPVIIHLIGFYDVRLPSPASTDSENIGIYTNSSTTPQYDSKQKQVNSLAYGKSVILSTVSLITKRMILSIKMLSNLARFGQ